MKILKIGRLTLLLLLLSATLLFPRDFPILNIVTEDWKPYHYIEDDELKGIVIDLTLLILEDLNSSQNIDDIKLYPWARSYRAVKKDKNTLLFSMTRTEEREIMFKWAGPIFSSSTGLIAKKSRNIEITDLSALKDYKIGTIIDDVSEIYVERLGLDKFSLNRTTWSTSHIKNLDNSRIDLMVSGWTAFVHNANTLGINPDDFELIYIIDSSDVNFAFNVDTDDETVDSFQQAFNRVKESGKLEELFNKYGEYYYDENPIK